MTVLRTADDTAEITATGTADTQTDRIRLIGATSVGDPGSDLFSGDFAMGAQHVTGVFVRSGATNFEINFASNFNVGDAPSGTLTATLDVESWASSGTTGNVLARGSEILGTFQIVPEPTTALLVACGLAGLSRAGRKRTARPGA